LEANFRRRRERSWSILHAELEAALASVRRAGFCAAAWQPQVVAVAAPLVTPNMAYAVNVSVLTTDPFEAVVKRLAPKLLTLRDDIGIALERAADAATP
jgi:DNA-binding IclR family transcriptional regulator